MVFEELLLKFDADAGSAVVAGVALGVADAWLEELKLRTLLTEEPGTTALLVEADELSS